LYYLHSFGIAHRDIKPENILLKYKAEDSEVKIVDFGLSKTFGPGETCNDPFGTLCYVAPEILLGYEYDKTVDIWSFGVMVYLLLGRHLPFDSVDEKEIGNLTVKNEISFSHEVWEPVSNDAKDLVLKLLDKNPKTRIKISQVLEHPWITGYDKDIVELRKKATCGRDKLMEFMAYCNTSLESVQANSPKVSEN